MVENQHPDLERVMMQPEFYPHPVDRVERMETHISIVFLAGESVYKIKKPVSLGFLDFSTLEKRRRFCREEVRLNRRLAEDIYEGVIAVTESNGRLTLNGDGNPVEYAVKMRRLPDRYTMGRLLAKNALDAADVQRLAAALAEFYRTAPRAEKVGGWETVHQNCEENFIQMKPFAGRIIAPSRFELIRTATTGFLERRHLLFEERLQEGSVREGHGDLRSEHVYFTPDGIQIIDCIEFNERMRYNDVASDIAFLAMDLDYQGAFHISEELLGAFVARFDDFRIFSLIDFYLCYRACVRLKVTCFRLQQESLETDQRRFLLERTRTFAALACRYAKRFVRPTVYVVMGMIAAGKSTVARALADSFGAELLSSDRIRKELFEKAAPGGDFEQGIYRREARARVYARMLLAAQERLKDHRSVILDATYSRQKQRAEAVRLAADNGAAIVFIECTCPDEVLRSRLKEREKGKSISDARLSLLEDFRKNYEPPEEIPPPARLRADTTRPLDRLVSELFIASRRVYPG
ncbi:MAG: AAA family ATPase [Desulfobacterales bacterium]|nr:AAA family ATPase [Desulfobacterales bacterium]